MSYFMTQSVRSLAPVVDTALILFRFDLSFIATVLGIRNARPRHSHSCSLPSGWHVDQAIEVEEDRVVCIRFGHDWDPNCMVMDETLYGVQGKLQNFAVIYLGELAFDVEV